METVQLLWAFVYVWAGWLWGGMIDWPWLGAIGGFFVGLVVGIPMGAAMLVEISLAAPLLAVAAWLLVPRPWLPHAAAAICALPLTCYFFFIARDAVRGSRGRGTVAGADTPDALVPHLGSEQDEVRAAAAARLARLNLPHEERARVIVQVAARLAQQGRSGDLQWLAVLVAPIAQAMPPVREALLLLYEHLGWVSSELRGAPGNADEQVQEVLFRRVQWDSDAPLRRAAQARIEKGWNVDRMVARLLDTDPEAGGRMAQDAFPAGALSAALLLRIGEARAAAVIEGEIARAMNSRIEHYDRIIEATLGLPPGKAFSLLERVLEWDPADYCIERGFEWGLMKDAQPTLEERCARAPAEAASFLTVVRAHIERLERYDWNAKFNPGWHPDARRKFWTALANALAARLGERDAA